MSSIIIDIILCGVLYAILLAFIFVQEQRKNKNRGQEGDDEGGLPVILPPDFDLPPGICWPGDGPRIKNEEPEEIFA